MGGNALKNVNTIRLSKQEYEQLKIEISNILNENLDKESQFKYVKELPEKESFGDIDIIIFLNKIEPYKFIKDIFYPIEIVNNGSVYSFDYKNFQIDFITTTSLQKLNMFDFYYSYGDLGGIIGRITNSVNIKFGQDGLFCNVSKSMEEYDITQTIGKIILSVEPQSICEYLNLDYNRYCSGFTTQDEIIEWVKTCKYYKKELFLHLNHEHRNRARKRPFYIKFMDSININVDDLSKNVISINTNYQMEAIKYFNKLSELNILYDKLKRHNIIKEKFTGKKFVDYGIEKKNIKHCIDIFKDYVMYETYYYTFDDYIYNEPIETIDEMVKKIVNIVKN